MRQATPLSILFKLELTHSVASIAVQSVDQDVGRVGLERNTVISVDNPRVSDDDVVGSVGIPWGGGGIQSASSIIA